jgi:hypothetical protein
VTLRLVKSCPVVSVERNTSGWAVFTEPAQANLPFYAVFTRADEAITWAGIVAASCDGIVSGPDDPNAA